MKPRQILIYLIIFIVLGGFYYIYDVRLAARKNELQEAQTRIFNATVDQVTAFKLLMKNREIHIIRTGPDQWRIEAPLKTPADRWAVEGVLRAALEGKKDRVFAEPVQDMVQYQLDNPGLSLTLLAGPKMLAPTLHIGGRNPAGRLYYARLGDTQEVFTITAALWGDLAKGLFDLRDKALVLAAGEKIDRLIIEGREKVEMKKTGLRQWEIVHPQPGPADNDVVQKMVYRVLKGKALRFVTPDKKPSPEAADPYGFDKPSLKVRVFEQGRPATELLIGREHKQKVQGKERVVGYWARGTDRPEIMLIEAAAFSALDVGYSELKDRHVLSLDRGALKEITIARGELRMHIKKVHDIWEVLEPKDFKSQDRHVERFLMTLEDLKYVQVLDADEKTIKKYGLHNPGLRIELSGPETHIMLVAELKAVEKGLCAVRVGEGPVVLVERRTLVERLPEEVRPAEPAAASR